MKTKFTPGPWVVDADDRSDCICEGHTAISSGVIDENSWLALAQVVTTFKGDDRNRESKVGKANAHLIAAAPELYALAVEIMELCGDPDHFNDVRADRFYEQALSVCKKARGEV